MSLRLALRQVFATSLLAIALVLGLIPTATTPAHATPSPAELERDFVALTNVERAKQGLHAVEVRTDIRDVARRWSGRMARDWRLYHNPNYTTEITGWQRLSENVGYGPSVEAIHRALMNSPGHRANILDERVTQVGIGVVVKDGRVWVTQNFRRPRTNLSFAPASSTRFGDVPSNNVHVASIENVAVRGIADPCGSARFCPADEVTRGEFATMLVRALDLPRDPSITTSRFRDVPSSQAADVEALARAGLTTGCASDRFCPATPLTREQLSTFFARALKLEPRPTTFGDVTATHAGSVGALQHRGIVNGCTTTRFCPGQRITRAQTASMIDRNLR